MNLVGTDSTPSLTFLGLPEEKLEEKGHLKHTTDRTRFVYLPTRAREEVGRAALQRVLRRSWRTP